MLSELAQNDDLKESHRNAKTAFDLALRTEDAELQFKAANQAATVNFYIGLFDYAAWYWIACLKIADEMDDQSFKAKASFNLSALYISLKKYRKASYYLDIAKNYFDEQTDSDDFLARQISILNNQAIIFQYAGEPEKAREIFTAVIDLARVNRVDYGLRTSLNAFATFLIEQREYVPAISAITELREMNKNSGFSAQVEATLLLKLYRIYDQYGNKGLAENYLYEGARYASASQSVSLMREYAGNLYLLEKKKKNVAKALAFKEEHDSLLRVEKTEMATAELERMELREEYKNLKNKLLSENQMNKNRFLWILIFIGIAFTPIVGFFMRKTLKARKVLSEKATLEAQKNQLDAINDNLKQDLMKKNRLLTTEALIKIKQKESLKDIIRQLENEIKANQGGSKKSSFFVEKLNDQIEQNAVWRDFDFRFNELNEGFYANLDRRFPGLTPNEKRLCAFLKLDFTTKEIVAVTGQTVRAVEIARTRLRKKLGISNTRMGFGDFFKDF